MNSISIDIETYSSIDLNRAGVYKYTEADDFEILLFGYSVDDGEVDVIDLACGEHIPEKILNALTDPSVEKSAYNANFERVCLSAYLHKYFPGKLKTNVFKNNAVSTVLSVVVFHGAERITDLTKLRSVFGTSAYLEWKWKRINDTDFKTISSSDRRTLFNRVSIVRK